MTVRFSPDQSWLHTADTFAPASSMANAFSSTVCVPPCTPSIIPSKHHEGMYCRLGTLSAASSASSLYEPACWSVSALGQESKEKA